MKVFLEVTEEVLRSGTGFGMCLREYISVCTNKRLVTPLDYVHIQGIYVEGHPGISIFSNLC